MNYALVLDGVVHNVYRNVEGEVSKAFPAIHKNLIECAPEVGPQWLFKDGRFSNPEDAKVEKTVREKRSDAYFAALKVEPGDDKLTVLGDQVDKLIAQIAAIVPAPSRTAEFSGLLSKVLAVKSLLPKTK